MECAVPLILYGLQHYLSIVGSLILIPLVIVPAMGGSTVSTTLTSCFLCLSFLSRFLLFVTMYSGFSWSSRSPMWYSVMNSVSCVCFSERYSQGYFKYALSVRNLHFTALLLWIKVTSYSRSLICLSCPNSCNHLLS